MPAILTTLLARYWKQLAIGAGVLVAFLWIWHAIAVHDRAQFNKGYNVAFNQFWTASQKADAAARKALADTERKYQEKANDADTKHAAALAAADDATSRFIATHRVPACPASGGSSGTVARAESDSAGVSASVPAPSVVVSGDDVQACAGAYAYAVSAYQWASGLKK